jgi:hypothetical protein
LEEGLEKFSESRKHLENEKIQESQENEKIQESQEKPKNRGVYSKEAQALSVERKRKELTGKGIDPESLLTRENLTLWLKSGQTYQRIARDYVGVHESIVSERARSFGLRSMVSKYKFFRRSK